MTHKNVKVLIICIAVAIIATGGLIWNLKGGGDGGGDFQVGDHQIMDRADRPIINSPGKQPPEPQQRVDNR